MATASTWLARSRTFPSYGYARPIAGRRRPSLLARIEQAISERRRRKAERLAAGLIERNGGHLTDSIEREIGNHSLRG